MSIATKAIRIYLHGGPQDGTVVEHRLTFAPDAPPELAPTFTASDDDSGETFVYHIVRLVERPGEVAEAHYRHFA